MNDDVAQNPSQARHAMPPANFHCYTMFASKLKVFTVNKFFSISEVQISGNTDQRNGQVLVHSIPLLSMALLKQAIYSVLSHHMPRRITRRILFRAIALLV